MKLFNYKTILKFTLCFLGVYLASFLGYLFPILSNIFFWLILLATFILSLKKLEWGVAILLAELFCGAKGYLFSFSFEGFVISLRIALFFLIILIWLISKFRTGGQVEFVKSRFFAPFALLTFSVGLSSALAVIYGNLDKYIFFDANSWVYFALIFIIFDLTLQNARQVKFEKFLASVLNLIFSSALALSLLVLFISLNFGISMPEGIITESGTLSEIFAQQEEQSIETTEIAHSLGAKKELQSKDIWRNLINQKNAIYRWTRDTGLVEITYVQGRLFRVFSSGQIYTVFALFFVLIILLQRKQSLKSKILLSLAFLIFALSLIISFSRSFWIGLALSFIFLLFHLPWKKTLKIIGSFAILILIFIFVTNFLIPSFIHILKDRINATFHPEKQSASLTRLNIIEPLFEKIKKRPLFGSGFGATIEYESVTPGRAGMIRVFAIEWGFLDIVFKMGFVGLFAYLWLIWRIFKEGYKANQAISDKLQNYKVIILSLLVSLFSLMVINITMPYLNHPLGIGYIILSAFIFYNVHRIAKKKFCLEN